MVRNLHDSHRWADRHKAARTNFRGRRRSRSRLKGRATKAIFPAATARNAVSSCWCALLLVCVCRGRVYHQNLGVRVMTSVVPSATQPAILVCNEHEARVISGHWLTHALRSRDRLLCLSRGQWFLGTSRSQLRRLVLGRLCAR